MAVPRIHPDRSELLSFVGLNVFRDRAPVARAGAAVSNLRRVLGGGGASGLGRVGFLAATRGARDWSSLVLVSNRHVLMAHGAAVGDPVFQPAIEGSGPPLVFARDGLDPVATIEDPGLEGHHRFAHRGEREALYFVDCATARLVAELPPVGGRGRRLFRRVGRAHPLDATPARGLAVRLLGVDARPAGRLIAADATVEGEGGDLRRNTLVIRSLPAADGTRPPFARVGDSGALVVDELERAIGLVWGVDLGDPRIAYACHIHPVLDRLGLTPWKRELAPVDELRSPPGDPGKEPWR